MKKLQLLYISLFLFTFNGISQQVNRDMVILEIVTGTWCYYCPGAAMGADDLIANGKNVAVIEYHVNDNYENTYGYSRKGFYSAIGYPTAIFDGIIEESGGNHNTSLYSTYLPIYNERIAKPSSFKVEIIGTHSGFTKYKTKIKVTKVADVNSNNLVLHLVLTESEIIKTWQNQDKLNFVERFMLPNQNGTELDFSTDDTNEITFNFTLDPEWKNENCEVIAFVQDPITKEIFQGTKKKLIEFNSSNTNDASILAAYCPIAVCKNTLKPMINIANYGSVSLTTLDIVYNINNEEYHTFEWSGNLSPLGNEAIELQELNFDIHDNNTFSVFTKNPNGQDDELPENDTAVININVAKEVNNTVALALKLDKNPEDISWKLLNSEGEIIYSGDNYTTPEQMIYKDFDLSQLDCYTFTIYDKEGNGLQGSGVWNLIYDESKIIANGRDFGLQQEVQFSVTNTDIIDNKELTDFQIYPNPVNNIAYVSFNLNNTKNININVYNSLGEIVYTISDKKFGAGENTIKINTSQFVNGIYYVNMNCAGENFQQKIVVTK